MVFWISECLGCGCLLYGFWGCCGLGSEKLLGFIFVLLSVICCLSFSALGYFWVFLGVLGFLDLG